MCKAGFEIVLNGQNLTQFLSSNKSKWIKRNSVQGYRAIFKKSDCPPPWKGGWHSTVADANNTTIFFNFKYLNIYLNFGIFATHFLIESVWQIFRHSNIFEYWLTNIFIHQNIRWILGPQIYSDLLVDKKYI